MTDAIVTILDGLSGHRAEVPSWHHEIFLQQRPVDP